MPEHFIKNFKNTFFFTYVTTLHQDTRFVNVLIDNFSQKNYNL